MKKMTDNEWRIIGLVDKWELSKDEKKKLEFVSDLLSSTCSTSLEELLDKVGETEVRAILELSKEDIQNSLKSAVEDTYREKASLRKRQKSIIFYSLGAQSAAESTASGINTLT